MQKRDCRESVFSFRTMPVWAQPFPNMRPPRPFPNGYRSEGNMSSKEVGKAVRIFPILISRTAFRQNMVSCRATVLVRNRSN